MSRVIAILALCFAIGLQWVALQSVAWTTMIIDYSKRAPLRAAIAQTFDGAHPCSLCHAVSKRKNSEKKSDLQPATPKIDMICGPRAISSAPPFVQFDYPKNNSLSRERSHSPPVPPPRLRLS